MNKVWRIFIYELQRNLRRKGFLFATFVLPLIGFVILFGNHAYQIMNSSSDDGNPLADLNFEAIKVAGYVDYSGEFDSVPELLDGFLIRFEDEAAAAAALAEDRIDVFYVIPPDYFETGEVILHIPQLQVTLLNTGPIEWLFYSTVAGNIDDLVIRRLRNPINVQEFDLGDEQVNGRTESTEGYEFAIVYASTMLFFFALLLTNTYLMQSVIEERENRLIEILISTVRPTQLLMGKILALGTLGLLQILAWGIAMGLMAKVAANLSTYEIILAALGVSMRWDIIPLMFVYFLLMYMTFASVFAGIGALSNSAQEGSQYIGLLVLPTILPFYAFPLIQTEPNGLLAVALSMIPITSPVSMQMRVVFGSVPLWQIGISMGLMAITMIGAMWLAGRLFRVQTLLSGQSFKLKELPGLLLHDQGAPRTAAS